MSMPFLQDPATSLSTIGLSIASGIICSVCAAILFRSAFAEQLGHQFMSNDSAIQYMTRRSRLLFIVSVLNVGESLRNGIQSTLLLVNTTRPNFFVIRVVYMCTFALSLPLQAYATCQRCAVIVTKEPVKRQRFLRITFWIIVSCWVVFEGGLIKYIVLLAGKGSSANDQEWFSTSYIDAPIVMFMAVLPLVIMASTAWALSVNLQSGSPSGHSKRVQILRSTESGGGTGTGPPKSAAGTASDGSLPSNSQLNTSSNGGNSESVVDAHPTQPAAPGPRTSSFSSISKSMRTSVSSMKKRPSATTRSTAKQSQLTYPLSRTFIALSVVMIALWTFGILAVVVEFLPKTIRSNPLNMLLSSLCVAVEASFETLLRKVTRAHQRREKERQVDKTFALTEAPGENE